MTVATTSSNAPDHAALIARAAQIRPILEGNAEQTDALRRLAGPNVEALRANGLCRLMVPRRFGGYQTSIRTYIEVMAEIGRGWAETQGPLRISLADSHAQFAPLHITESGVVH